METSRSSRKQLDSIANNELETCGRVSSQEPEAAKTIMAAFQTPRLSQLVAVIAATGTSFCLFRWRLSILAPAVAACVLYLRGSKRGLKDIQLNVTCDRSRNE